MLTKSLCKKCYNEHRVRPWDKFRRIDKLTKENYVQKDRTWDRHGRMACVACLDIHLKLKYVKVDGPAPDCCYYLVEQMMLSAQKDSESGAGSAMNDHE
jgi:hypothetical protein